MIRTRLALWLAPDLGATIERLSREASLSADPGVHERLEIEREVSEQFVVLLDRAEDRAADAEAHRDELLERLDEMGSENAELRRRLRRDVPRGARGRFVRSEA